MDTDKQDIMLDGDGGSVPSAAVIARVKVRHLSTMIDRSRKIDALDSPSRHQ
jgi:hypothetical protein